jgi:hypothetical protein
MSLLCIEQLFFKPSFFIQEIVDFIMKFGNKIKIEIVLNFEDLLIINNKQISE